MRKVGFWLTTVLITVLVPGAASLARAADDPTGTWTIASRGEAPTPLGSLDLAPEGSGSFTATRTSGDAVVKGRASVEGDELRVGWGEDGFTDALGSGDAAAAVDRYTWDATARAWVGVHAGSPEVLEHRGGNAVEILVDGGAFLPALLQEISGATKTLHIETYIWKDDEVGRQVADAAIERAHAGVRVRAILDWAGSLGSGALVDRLRAGGVQVVWFNKLGLQTLGDTLEEIVDVIRGRHSIRDVEGVRPHALDTRDHRKSVVVDGRVAFLGGFCLEREGMAEWHDVHARLRGPAVAEVERNFLESWRAGGGAPVDETAEAAGLFPAPELAGDSTVHAVTTVPGSAADLKALYLQKVQGARREVLLETPYFSDGELCAALEAAVSRGVAVKLILPADRVNDVRTMAVYHATIRHGLWAAGIELHDYPRMSHGKVGLVDGAWGTVGSCNLDNRSFVRDWEENLSVEDPGFGADLRARVFDPDLATAPAWKPTDEPEHLGSGITSWFAGLFHDLL